MNYMKQDAQVDQFSPLQCAHEPVKYNVTIDRGAVNAVDTVSDGNFAFQIESNERMLQILISKYL